jgi:hypothetical protein
VLPKKWVIGVTSLLLVVLLLTGYLAVAAEYGSQNDPLVTLSYIEELLPELQKTIDNAVNEKTAEFDSTLDKKIEEAMNSIDAKIAQFETGSAADVTDDAFVQAVADAVTAKIGSAGGSGDGTAASGAPELFKVERFKSGQTVIGDVGTEILWRLGNATVVSSGSPGLIDVSAGSDLPKGGQLQQNHLYIVTVEGRGFKVTSDCIILIKGGYTTK